MPITAVFILVLGLIPFYSVFLRFNDIISRIYLVYFYNDKVYYIIQTMIIHKQS
jgi:hypothetical protein